MIQKVAKGFFLILFFGFLIAVAILSVAKEDVKSSYAENRSYEQFSKPTKETILNGEWFADFETYSKDQIIYREKIIQTYYKTLDSLQVKERNDFVVGEDSFVMPINNYLSEASLNNCQNYGQAQVEAMSIIADAAGEYGGQVLYVNIPNKNDLYSEKYPEHYYAREDANQMERASIVDKAKAAGIHVVETYDLLAEHKDEYIYYNTDHHFTIKGGYYVYKAILEKINELNDGQDLTFPDWEELDVQRNDSRMAGSYLRVWGDSKSIDVDYMEYAIPYDMPEYVRTDNGNESDRPLFSLSSTAYTSFMGGDTGNTVIDTNREELPSVLYVGFSFTNALEVLSVYNFDTMESLDPRHWDGSICEYIKESQPDYVVIVRDDIYEGNKQYKGRVR